MHMFTGRILNRFSKDIGQMDDLLPMTFFDMIGVRSKTFFLVLFHARTMFPRMILFDFCTLITCVYVDALE